MKKRLNRLGKTVIIRAEDYVTGRGYAATGSAVAAYLKSSV
jgi:hypothetical protein